MGLFSPTITNTSSSSTSTPPPWADLLGQRIASRAEALSNVGYQPYPGARVAGFSPLQNQAFKLAGSTDVGMPQFNAAYGAAQGALQSPTAAGIQAYMNPYTDLVTQRTIEEMRRQNQIGGLSDAAQAVQLGAFGGSRTGVVEAERARNYDTAVANMVAQQNQQNYAQALGQFNTQQQYGLTGAGILAGLGQTAQQMQNANVTQLSGLGQLQQNLSQANMDVGYQDFLRQVGYPEQQLSFLSNTFQGIPGANAATTSTTQQIPGASLGQQLAGTATGVLGVIGSTGGFGDNGWLKDLKLW